MKVALRFHPHPHQARLPQQQPPLPPLPSHRRHFHHPFHPLWYVFSIDLFFNSCLMNVIQFYIFRMLPPMTMMKM